MGRGSAGGGYMGLSDEIRMVLEVEQEGRRRLTAAHAEARSLVERARAEARQIVADGEERVAGLRRSRNAEMEAEIADVVAGLDQRLRGEEERLRRLAERNRGRAVERIMAWLWGEV